MKSTRIKYLGREACFILTRIVRLAAYITHGVVLFHIPLLPLLLSSLRPYRACIL